MTQNFPIEQSIDIIFNHDKPISTPVYILVPVTVRPNDADIKIGLRNTRYTSLNASVATQMSICTTLPAPVTMDIDHDRQCQSGASGRYVYVYKQRLSGGTYYMHISEFNIFGDPAVGTRM